MRSQCKVQVRDCCSALHRAMCTVSREQVYLQRRKMFMRIYENVYVYTRKCLCVYMYIAPGKVLHIYIRLWVHVPLCVHIYKYMYFRLLYIDLLSRPRSVETRPRRLRLETEIKWHLVCYICTYVRPSLEMLHVEMVHGWSEARVRLDACIAFLYICAYVTYGYARSRVRAVHMYICNIYNICNICTYITYITYVRI